MARRKSRTPTVVIVSDGRGETAAQLLKAAAVQFEGKRYRVVREAEVRTGEQVAAAVERAAEAGGIIFYTLVSDDTRLEMKRICGEKLVAAVDLLGPAFSALHDLFESQRASKPGLLYALDRERFDRMNAIDYTLKHDDGQRPSELSHADVVLVGVSRASKSSTCFFLGYEGIRAANVPLLPGIDPPKQLLRLPRRKVVGLRVNVDRLITVREARAYRMRLRASDPYLDKRVVAREVIAANRLMEEHDWQSIDVSYLAVEEIARETIRLCSLERKAWW